MRPTTRFAAFRRSATPILIVPADIGSPRDRSRVAAARTAPTGAIGCGPYHRSMGLPAPWLIALVLLCFVLAAIPTRRLSQAGLRPGWLGTYLLVLVLLGVVVVALRGPGRFLIPFLVVLYVAPLVVAPATAARWFRRGRRPPKNVGSGPGRDIGPDDPRQP
jgi:hypothetical protein